MRADRDVCPACGRHTDPVAVEGSGRVYRPELYRCPLCGKAASAMRWRRYATVEEKRAAKRERDRRWRAAHGEEAAARRRAERAEMKELYRWDEPASDPLPEPPVRTHRRRKRKGHAHH